MNFKQISWPVAGAITLSIALAPAISRQDAGANTVIRQSAASGPEVGKPAPDFSLKDQNGKTHSLADYKGKTVVLAFYPKDDTPGCTAQMCGFRDALPKFQEQGIVILGVSVQDTASKKAFADKYKLTFPVLADSDKAVTKTYGALGANGVADRITFIIGPDGTLQNVDRAARLFRQDGKVMSDHAETLALMLSADWKVALGKPVPSFTLTGYDGAPVTSTSNQADLTVLMFVSTKCGVSNDYNIRMARFAKDFADKGGKRVRFVGINANTDEKPEAIAKHAKDNGFPFPIAKDEHNAIADHFQAVKTPEVWVIDRRGVARYHGAIDDHFDETMVKKTYLLDALNALLEDKDPAVKEVDPQGCNIKRERRARG